VTPHPALVPASDTAVGGLGLLVAAGLVVGFVAGRSRTRGRLLVLGVAVIAVAAAIIWVVTGRVDLDASQERLGAQLADLFVVALPALVAFVAGWVCGPPGWRRRIVVLVVAAALVAFLPYAALGTATAGVLQGTA
jgi:hypothetical protein